MGYIIATPPLLSVCYTFLMTQLTYDKNYDKKPLLDRLSRAEGQIRALRQALEHDTVHDCKAFISQIKAARTALKRTSEQYVLHHINSCQALPESEREQQIGEALKVLSSD